MADTKITALAAITTVDPAADVLPIVDVSDTSMAASGTTKKITSNQILGAGGTATLASATITGAATVGTTLGVTGNLAVQTNKLAVTTTGVGCGIATPSNQLHVKSTSSTPALIETSGGALTYLQFTSTTGSAYVGNNANGLGFYTTGSADLRMSLAAAGDLSITSGNVVMATSGKGIDFTATPGTGTSELLNDYEEGTWTPTFTAASGTPTTVTLNSATYTKIGRRVFLEVDFTITAAGTASAALYFTLPFSQASSPSSCGAFRESFATGSMGQLFHVDATRTGASFYNDATVWVNTYRLRGTYTYNV